MECIYQDRSDNITQMRGVINVGQSRGNEDIPLPRLWEDWMRRRAHGARGLFGRAQRKASIALGCCIVHGDESTGLVVAYEVIFFTVELGICSRSKRVQILPLALSRETTKIDRELRQMSSCQKNWVNKGA